ncbi:MAG TPA: arginine--tRNA ligase [Spirochaetia bacterium]|nr:arginine--tRNA ligase [Spirochaetia bacterium]
MLELLEKKTKTLLIEKIKETFQESIDPDQIKLAPPPQKEMGDICAPVGFLLTKTLKKNPFEIVSLLAEKMSSVSEFKDVQPAKPGYVNFFYSESFIEESVKEILENEKALDFNPIEKTFFLEYVSANPTGPLHIGHGRWAALGDSAARLLKKIGYRVYQEFYVNDAGNQVENLKKTVEALKSGKPVPEDGYHGEYVQDALKSELEPQAFFLEEQKKTLEKFRCAFDSFYSEKSLHESGAIEKAIRLLKEKGVLYEQEGALWFRSTDYGDDKDRVLIKSDGNYTYFAPDIAYHLTKIERGGDELIDILGADHHGYVKRITAAVSALSEKKVKLDILIGQLVNLFRNGDPVRMSKRSGEIITLDEVMDEIGVDALRYILVSKKHTQTVDFDLEEVKKQSKDNPVFYIQYAFARIHSIKKNIEEKDYQPEINFKNLEESERQLLLFMLRFKDEVYKSALNFDPQILAAYLFDLASLFHQFYEKNRVIDQGNPVKYRLAIIETVSKVLEEGLSLLGMAAPKRM